MQHIINVLYFTFIFYIVLELFLRLNAYCERVGRKRLEAEGKRHKGLCREAKGLMVCYSLLISLYFYVTYFYQLGIIVIPRRF
ncbi:putative membrane protein [Synechococcus sp. MEDNS5]|nr:putative membrane protein [Synechococcus sp. MEDNS5]